jgi:hypothetical protein
VDDRPIWTPDTSGINRLADDPDSPRIVHFEKRTAPWMAVELFQLSAAFAEPVV